MRFSVKWLQKYLDLKLDPQKLAVQLTDIGLEVEEQDGDIIEISVPPNREDCLGYIGIVREIAAVNGLKFVPPAVKNIPATIADKFKLDLKNSNACIKYLGRVIRGIDNSGQSPQWLQDCLTTAGMKIISPVVDITNFVQLEYGQPVHAFNLAAIEGQTVIARDANNGEALTLLDDSVVELQEGALVIADANKPMALAGIKGGKDSGVYAYTKDILLECAYFDQISIRLTSRKYKIQSDSSYRNERGIDPDMQEIVMQRLSQLILEIVGGQAGEVISVTEKKNLPKEKIINVRNERVRKVLGIDVPLHITKKILESLGMEIIADNNGTLGIKVPSFRTDISREIDLIEEVTRIYGYNNIPAQLPVSNLYFNRQTEAKISEQILKACLISRGYNEAITYSFIDSEFAKKFGEQVKADLCLANPISAEMNFMRSSLLPGLVQTLAYNQNRQQARVRLFETGLRFLGTSPEQQIKTIAGVCTGNYLAENWAMPNRAVDFYDLKGDIEALFAQTKLLDKLSYNKITDNAMHPGQSMAIMLDSKQVGKLGALHPRLLQELGLNTSVYMFELDYDAVTSVRIPSFTEFSKYPAVRRDLALLLANAISYEQVRSAIAKVAGSNLESIVIFDRYIGKGIPEGKKSIAVAVTLQSNERTLVDAEVEDTFANIIKALAQEYGASLR